MEKVNLLEKFDLIEQYWTPAIAGELNGQMVKLVKLKGAFIWHLHEQEDELFYVVKGSFAMELKDRTVHLQEGEFFIVPKGVDHRPVAEQEAWVMLFEPGTTPNTGNVVNERTVQHLSTL